MGRRRFREIDLVRAILELLNASGIPAWRQNAGLVVIREGPRRRVVRLGQKGMPDIVGIIPPHGRFLAVEVKKDPGRRPTPHQEAFLTAVREAGGVCAVVKGPQDLEKLLEEIRSGVEAHQHR